MKAKAAVRSLQLMVLAGALALVAGVGIAHHSAAPAAQAGLNAVGVQVADGSESTGKPPKPKGLQIADGSESTGKPPKPKNA